MNDRAQRELFARGDAGQSWAHPVMPLVRLFEILGSYTNRGFVPHAVVTDMWAPVVIKWWDDLTPVIALMRRTHGAEMFENWEALTVRSKRCIAEHRSSYPKGLPRIDVVDPWPGDAEVAG